MNEKWLSHYKSKGMTENDVFKAFFTRKDEYAVLTEDEKTELNQWIDEQREHEDEPRRTV